MIYLQKAHEDKSKLINDARTDSVKLISKKQKELEKKNEELIQTKKSEIDSNVNSKIKKGKVELKKFEDSTKKNLKDATKLIIDKLRQKIEEL